MKHLFRFFLICLMVLAPAWLAQATVFKIATLAPEGAFEVTQMRAAADLIETETQGRVSFKFFTGGVMGNDSGVLRKIRINQLQGGAVSSGSLSSYYPDNQIYSLPMMFLSFEEIDYVRERLDPVLIQGYRDAGFVIFGLAEGGFAYIMSTSPIATIPELQSRKVWAPDNESSVLEAVKAFGISPITLSVPDVRTGLQTGLLDTVAIPPAYAILLHWHTQVKYLTDLPILYTYGVLAITERAFGKLSTADQDIVTRNMTEAFDRVNRKNREQNAEALEVLKGQGIDFVKPEGMDVWQEKADLASSQWLANGLISEDIMNQLQRLLKDYRNQ